MRICHIITGLSTGGAEMMLFKLLSRTDCSEFHHEVISLTDIGPIGERIQSLGIRVRALGMSRGLPNPLYILKLVNWLMHSKPTVVQTWMYHADLIGGIAAKISGNVPVVWGIRHSYLDPKGSKYRTIFTAKLCARLSTRIPRYIICCSEASRRVHVAIGYSEKKMEVIQNGFDLNAFKPDSAARSSVCSEFGIPENTILIGMVARFDPQKDHYNLIEAAALLNLHYPKFHLILCGDGVDPENKYLVDLVNSKGLSEKVHLLGKRTDIPRINAAFDIATSSSFSEGFPNVIGEAMACGTPCVVTDVGDSAFIVGKTGRIVKPRNSAELAKAWQELIAIGSDARFLLGNSAQKRIIEKFELSSIVHRYEQLYKKTVISDS